MRGRQFMKVAVVAVILILVLVFVYSRFRILESTVFSSGEQTAAVEGKKTITRDEVDYFPRQDMETYLLMGIDRFGPMEDSGAYNNDGEADAIMLLVFDKKQETIRVLALNRDTMVEMPVLGIGGRQAGTAYGQLALAHTYGSGLKDSCENVRKTVSDLLLHIEIDHYIAMNMDGIALLNDAVGGVEVEVLDDFSQVDPTIPMGKTVLTGEQALSFVRVRKEVGDQLNVSRMDRQRAYMEGFLTALRGKLEQDSTFAVKLFEELSPYLVTDGSSKVFTSAMDRYGDYALEEIVTPKGENRMGEEYLEFYADEDALDALTLRLFYAPK